MRFKIIFILLFITIFAGYMLFKQTNTQQNKQELVIGMASGYAPFISMNEQGDYEGFDIDVAQNLAAALNKKLVLKDLGSMTSLIIALEQGSIDAIMWGMDITRERAQKYATVRYCGKDIISNPLVFWKTIPSGITNLADMNGLTVCVEPTSSQSAILAKYNDIVLMPTEKVDDALLALQYGKATAALLDPVIGRKFKTKYPEIKVIDVPLEPEDQTQGVGILIKKDNTRLVDQITQAVAQLKNNGIIEQFEQKWGLA